MRYGYCRTSKPKQSIERQIRNIKAAYTEEITTKMLERILRESLTPTQYGIYKACILNGISYKAYADQMGVSYQSVQNAIRLIQKKSQKYFWLMVVVFLNNVR